MRRPAEKVGRLSFFIIRKEINMSNKRLEQIKADGRYAEIKLTAERHKKKNLENQRKELTRKARTRRLCTRGGMLESFLEAPNILTDDDVMELLTFIFDFNSVQRKLNQIIVDRKEAIMEEIEAEAEEDP